MGVSIFIVGHVTKDGNVAGPRGLEHIVDTVLYCEGERHASYRILRGVKNRFGSTKDVYKRQAFLLVTCKMTFACPNARLVSSFCPKVVTAVMRCV